MLRVSLRNLLVRDAFKVVPLDLAMSSKFWLVFYGWSSLSVSRLVLNIPLRCKVQWKVKTLI